MLFYYKYIDNTNSTTKSITKYKENIYFIFLLNYFISVQQYIIKIIKLIKCLKVTKINDITIY